MHDMEALLQRLALLARAETLAVRIRARHAARAVAFSSAALAAAMFAFGLLNLCAFNLLAAAFGENAASLVLAAVDAVLGLILFVLARRRVQTPEEVMVDELRALALAELANDAARLKAQVHQLQHQVTQIGEGIARVTNAGPLQFGLASIGPILSMASRLLNRKKDV
jgi:hypothetical protein